MPKYSKFMKDALSKKKKMKEFEMVVVTKEYRSILQNKLTLKAQ